MSGDSSEEGGWLSVEDAKRVILNAVQTAEEVSGKGAAVPQEDMENIWEELEMYFLKYNLLQMVLEGRVGVLFRDGEVRYISRSDEQFAVMQERFRVARESHSDAASE